MLCGGLWGIAATTSHPGFMLERMFLGEDNGEGNGDAGIPDGASGCGDASAVGWVGRARDCTCGSAEAHDRDTDRAGGPRCATHLRRRGDAKLAQYRVWMAEQFENECLIADHAADPVDTVASAQQTACEALTVMQAALGDLDAGCLDGDALMGTVLALEDTQRRLDAAKAVTLGALEASGATEAKAGLGTKRWKANRTHGSDATVGRELKIARTLKRFPAFSDVLGEGLISVDHVLALAAVCNDTVALHRFDGGVRWSV